MKEAVQHPSRPQEGLELSHSHMGPINKDFPKVLVLKISGYISNLRR